MQYDDKGLSATHEEVVAWMQWFGTRARASKVPDAVLKQWAQMTAQFLASGKAYLTRQMNCEACGGTGRSRLSLPNAPSECTWCKGTGYVEARDESE